MTNTNMNQELIGRVECLVQQYIAAARKEVEAAVARAFASAITVTPSAPRQLSRSPSPRRRRASRDVAVLSERLYEAVCAKPGETMSVVSAKLGASSRELHRPMALLKRDGRVRSAGSCHATRYYPMVAGASTSA